MLTRIKQLAASACMCLISHGSSAPGVVLQDSTVAKTAWCMAVGRQVVCQQEALHCRRCSTTTRHLHYTTQFHNVVATSLAAEQRSVPGRRLGQLLQAVDAARRSCDPDHGIATYSADLCGVVVWQEHTLLSWAAPTVCLRLWCRRHT